MNDVLYRWTYSGLIGILVGGELLTAGGAALFFYIDPNWPALVCLVASIVALLLSTRKNMMRVENTRLHRYTPSPGGDGPWFEFLIPGPLILVRYLLSMPVWPIAIVYAGSHSFWPFGDPSWPRSEDALWINPSDWLRIEAPTDWFLTNANSMGRPADSAFNITSSTDSSNYNGTLYGGDEYFYTRLLIGGGILPHLLGTFVVALSGSVIALVRLVQWYFVCMTPSNIRDNNYRGNVGINESRLRWDASFTSQESVFHCWAAWVQAVLGFGYTYTVCKLYWLAILCASIVWMLLVFAVSQNERPVCLEQEWAFVYAHWAWWVIMIAGHLSRRYNIFFRR